MDKVLILGGTNFIGRNLVERLLQEGEIDITLFNRGQTNDELFPKIRRLSGDRNTPEINQVFKERWDYIIDLSCFFPNSLEKILQNIDKSLKRYIFISTCSVYDNENNKSILRNEDAPTLDCNHSERIDTSVNTYGKRKAECERILKQSGFTHTIFRPSLVYGQYDNIDRLYYWLHQIKKEKPLLIPNQGTSIFSVTYVKDLIQAILKSINRSSGSNTFNLTTHPKLSIIELVNTAKQLLSKPTKTHFVTTKFLIENNVKQWVDLPLWLDCDYFTYDNSKVLKELNLEVTEFTLSVAATIDYYDSLAWQTPTYGMTDKTKNDLIEE